MNCLVVILYLYIHLLSLRHIFSTYTLFGPYVTDTALKDSRSLYCFNTSISHGVDNYFPRLWGTGISDAIFCLYIAFCLIPMLCKPIPPSFGDNIVCLSLWFPFYLIVLNPSTDFHQIFRVSLPQENLELMRFRGYPVTTVAMEILLRFSGLKACGCSTY